MGMAAITVEILLLRASSVQRTLPELAQMGVDIAAGVAAAQRSLQGRAAAGLSAACRGCRAIARPHHPTLLVVAEVLGLVAPGASHAGNRCLGRGTAQAAHQEGEYVARTIVLEYAKKPSPPYHYTEIGHLALLGHYTGVARLGPFSLRGRAAWLLWHLAYLQRNPSWNKRIRLVLDWLVSGLLGREVGQLRLTIGLTHQMSTAQTLAD